MKNGMALLVVVCGLLLAGCAEKAPESPPGYVDPGTDPAAVGAELKSDLNEGAPK